MHLGVEFRVSFSRRGITCKFEYLTLKSKFGLTHCYTKGPELYINTSLLYFFYTKIERQNLYTSFYYFQGEQEKKKNNLFILLK
jgi:hypothetical protein